MPTLIPRQLLAAQHAHVTKLRNLISVFETLFLAMGGTYPSEGSPGRIALQARLYLLETIDGRRLGGENSCCVSCVDEMCQSQNCGSASSCGCDKSGSGNGQWGSYECTC